MNLHPPTSQPLLPDDIHEALNAHGVFFKKRVIQELRTYEDLHIAGEEIGESFGKTRVADILAFDRNPHEQDLFFVIECKRVDIQNKVWIFFKDIDPTYKTSRESSIAGALSIVANGTTDGLPVCSEGFEFDKKKNRIDQDPIFQAGNQIAGAFLGFMARRHGKRSTRIKIERFVPVLVTTAKLLVVESELSTTELHSGTLKDPPETKEHQHVILKQPFATPEGLGHDFRDDVINDPWVSMHRESIHVVTASGLSAFFSKSRRKIMHDVQSLTR
ncbi:MAG: hypothetical protein HS117_15615 [Verrucomicrobiaceae bacterium]|nr:hypothetical protein [Verrucomicrobiaceae bacterium]